MYNYTYDKKTGGVLLNTSPMQFSKEPRPVYYKELDLLGLDKYWEYEKQDNLPYMWAEANKYYYFGRLVAQTKGGNLYTAPEIEIKEELSEPLRPVDINAMIEKNADFLQVLEQDTVKKIYDVWKRYKGKLDVFHVAFSGGKDSIVLLDLVKKALPKDEFVVVFGDTQMEFPDTYDVVDKIEAQCKAEGIRFYRAKSHMDVYESWKQFAPPSRVLRWCCSVHKSTPQVIKLREVLGKDDYRGMAFVGVRGAESARRSEYEFESNGMKQKGQRSANPILDWTSCEVWLYIYANNLIVNGAYKKGNSRAGCLNCPMTTFKSAFFQHANYNKELEELLNIVSLSNGRDSIPVNDYLANGTWNARKNGRYLKDNPDIYKEIVEEQDLIITLETQKQDWKEWIKTLGDLQEYNGKYVIVAKELVAEFTVENKKNGFKVILPIKYTKTSPLFGKLFRQVFRKSAYCVECKNCLVNCKRGCISFENGLKITNCIKCRDCHEVTAGCLAYDSLKIPQGADEKMKSINSFSTHPPKTEWLINFFDDNTESGYLDGLGPAQKTKFNRFLKDANLISNNKKTPLANKLSDLSWDSPTSLGIILSNVAYNPQFEWYIKNICIGSFYTREDLKNMLLSFGTTENNATAIMSSFKRIVQTPFGLTLNFGYVDSEDNFTRNKCIIGSPLVVLYSLYKFAEACGDYYEFTISRLLNYNIDSDGLSPMQIFGIEEDEMKTILQGLTASNPDFITAKFTHDLDTISLNKNKTASDVLSLL